MYCAYKMIHTLRVLFCFLFVNSHLPYCHERIHNSRANLDIEKRDDLLVWFLVDFEFWNLYK